MKSFFQITVVCFLLINTCIAQQIPALEENIPYLVTFGKEANKSWGDCDFVQTFYFVIPQNQVHPFYIRVFDPDICGDNDEKRTVFNTKTKFSVYGGKSCFTRRDIQSNKPVENHRSGNLLRSKTFGNEPQYDQKWYSFGPFNPTEGEFVNEYGGYIFKIIATGISGDDGNLYQYFLSSSPTENKVVEGGNAFTFEYTFRLSDSPNSIAHLYPYVEENVISIKIYNFDFDNDGDINIVSMAKRGEWSKASGDGVWSASIHEIVAKEKKTVLDVQFIKNKKIPVKNNNVSLYITNQYGDRLPIYTVPIGGIAHHNYKINFGKQKQTAPY